MSGIFVSHSSKDHPIAAEISAWLKQQGYASVFLDFDPSDGIPAGRNWAQELYRELKKCRAMLILCSEPSQASEWCFAEFFHAKAMGKAIIPIKIAPCAIRPLISELQVIDLTHNRAEGLERLGRGLREAGMEPDAGYNPDRPLYPGLAVFQEEDSPIFFGREAEIQECLDRLRKLREFGGYRLVLILGASGSGKSSLIRAGIIPRLKRAQAFWRIVGPVRPSLLAPGDDLDALTARFVPEFDRASGGQTVEMTPAACDPAAIVRQAGTAAGNDATPVLFIDQLEELLDKQLSQSADRFLKQLTDWLRSRNSRALAVATLRSDYLGEFQQHPAFRDIDFEKLTLGPLSRAGFEKVIEEPAKLVGLELEPGLVRTMLEATETGDALPLLAFTLGELWERHGGDGRLTVSEYRELGGLEGSVALAAEAVLNAEATTEEQRENLKNAFIPLVRMDHQKRYVRRLVRWSTIDRRFHAVLERFVAKRLLVSKSENGDRVLEVAHEALFRTWSRLEKWLDADLVNLRLWEGLRHAAREWEEGSRRGYLLNHRDSLLEDVEKLAAEPRFAIDPVERAYLDACIGLQKEKLRRELAEQRRLYGFIVFLVAAVIAVSYFGYLADLRRETAQRHLMSLHWVNGVFARDRGKDVLKAVHHFAAAAESADDALNKRNAYLAGALLTRGIHLASVIGHDLKLKSAVFGRDSKQVWTWDESGAGRAWDLSSGSIVKTAEFEGNPESIRTSPGGTWIIGQGIDGTVGIVDARSGQVILDTGQKRGWPVFSDDEGKLAGWDETGRVSIFDIAGNAETARFQAPFEPERMVLSVSGERLVLIGRRNGIHLWSGRHDTVVCHGPSGSGVVGAVISPNDSRMISWHSDGSAALWDIRNGCESIASLPGQAGHPSIIGALFNNDASTILIWNHSREGALSRWRAKTGEAVQFQSEVNPEFVASSSAIRKGILNKDESLLLTASDDGQAILWDVASSKAHRVFRHRAGVRGAVFDAGERRVLTWSDDGSARLWDIESGRAIGFPLAQGGQIRRAAFSEDGDRILTWGEDGMARIWLIEGRA
ncbi:MAG: nSTAND1 domain-containing NTPase, partial [Gammaproteobacteria bacterium]